jgi:glycosyltransferase involved in cell wall biosynthesis
VGASDKMSDSDPLILTMVGSYIPGYKAGGPIRSIANLVAALGQEFRFKIVTLDRDLGDSSPYPNVEAGRWVRVGQADVMYMRPGLRGLVGRWALLRSLDRNTILYVNSFFDRRSSMLAVFMCWLKLCRPRCLVLAPRGEFSPNALQLKHTRKHLYTRISRWLGLYQNLIWHASSHFEAVDIMRQMVVKKEDVVVASLLSRSEAENRTQKTSTVVTALDLPNILPVRQERRPKTAGQLRVVFVARCSRMKNLLGALKLLAGVSGEVSFDIYGPAEDVQYWQECQELIAMLPPNIRVRYEGQIEHERVAQVFAEHELFLFPTLGENYGHVIYEALASGCPVLISDKTPWRNLEAAGVGWDIPLEDTKCFQSVLQRCVDADDEWLTAMSTRAVGYAIKRASAPEMIDANRELFQRAFAWPHLPEPARDFSV